MDLGQALKQQRRFPRFQYEKAVVIGLLRGDSTAYARGRSIDLAEGGAGIRSDRALDIGEILDLQIPLQIGELRVPATVRYQRGSEYGVEFLGLGVTEREYIRQACKKLPQIG